MTNLIDNSAPRPPRPLVRVNTFTIGDLTFTNEVLMDPKQAVKLKGKFKHQLVHPDIRCDTNPEVKGNKGFTREQIREKDFPNLLFGIFSNGEVIGGLSLVRIKLISQDRGDIQVSALLTPFLPNPGSDVWTESAFTIIQYLLATPLPTETDGVTMHFKRLERPEGANSAFKKMQHSGGVIRDMNLASRNLRLVEAPDTLRDGRKVFYIERDV